MAFGMKHVIILFVVSANSQDLFLSTLEQAPLLMRPLGPALDGVDVVAYWSLPAGAPPVFGSEEFSTIYTALDRPNETNAWNYTLLFSSAANRDTFASDPARYLPAWGGFCSMGISQELSPDWPWSRSYLGPPGNTSSWYIYKGKLYLSYFKPLIEKWMINADENVAIGNSRWQSWFGDLSRGFLNRECTAKILAWPDTCTLYPQTNTGIPPSEPITAKCTDAMNAHCQDIRMKKVDDPMIGAQNCEACLQQNQAGIIQTAAGHCPLDPKNPESLGKIASNVYCL